MVSELIDASVMPGVQGGPLMHVIAAKAVAFGEALKPSFRTYTEEIIKNAKTMAEEFLKLNYKLVSGGTDTHVVLIDLTNKNITGREAEKYLGQAGIHLNKNMVPFDDKSPFVTSGIRFGTAAITTRGIGNSEIIKIVDLIDEVIENYNDDFILKQVKTKVNSLMSGKKLFNF